MIRFLIVIFHFQSIITLQILEIDVRQSVMKFNFTQKKLNQTFQLIIQKEETSKYLLIELFVKNQSKSSPNLMLLQSYGQAPFYDLHSPKKRIICDNYDINGQQQSKKYHYLQLNLDQNRDLQLYLTILTNKTKNYYLQFTASNIIQCPNNCNKNGQCIHGQCQCKKGFLDEDCSQTAQLFLPFKMQNIQISNQQYIYTMFNTTSNYSLSLAFESTNINKSKINIQMLVSQRYNLPCDINNNYNHTVWDQKRVEIKLLQESYLESNFSQQSHQNLLIIKLSSEEDINYKIQLDFQIHYRQDKEEIVTIILIITLTLILIFALFFIFWYCFRRQKKNSSNNQQFMIPALVDIDLNPQCSICLEDFIKTEEQLQQQVKTDCLHIFHKECLNHWRKNRNTCPICRKSFI
ncbi:unnamed protein product [Paramecium pentaurelia]|uniref:RING-type domain-containing protein n=1 Tax=Paramecium pentaurelia TaxID=43138 RepID=A0A8S1SAX6_9CILI|nr:unnamed protein product [Paramecium pentaurelia]